MTIDVVNTEELNCGNCGEPLSATICPEHGPQENAVIHAGQLRCVEWNYDIAAECHERLDVECSACGTTQVEGLDDGEL